MLQINEYDDDDDVCLSVCPSHACIVTKR